jgi:hypothetical protein
MPNMGEQAGERRPASSTHRTSRVECTAVATAPIAVYPIRCGLKGCRAAGKHGAA